MKSQLCKDTRKKFCRDRRKSKCKDPEVRDGTLVWLYLAKGRDTKKAEQEIGTRICRTL